MTQREPMSNAGPRGESPVPPSPATGPAWAGRIPPSRRRALLLGLGTIGAAVGVFFLLGALDIYNVPFVIRNLPAGLGPATTSLGLTVFSFAMGFFLALPLAFIRAYGPGRFSQKPQVVRRPAGALRMVANGLLRVFLAFANLYVAAIRGTPALVQVFLVYYAVIFSYPRLEILGQPAPFWAGLLALTINTTGYQAEALRGGFQSVEPGQVDAAKSVGLNGLQIFLRITLPQGLRLVTLPLANEWISNFKTTTVLSYVTVFELFAWARTYLAYQLAHPVEAFVTLAIFYLAINVTVSRVVTYIEQRIRIPGLGTPGPETSMLRFPGRPGWG